MGEETATFGTRQPVYAVPLLPAVSKTWENELTTCRGIMNRKALCLLIDCPSNCPGNFCWELYETDMTAKTITTFPGSSVHPSVFTNNIA
ncbi:hypothetical protein E2P81_ATG05316 [Venturia nashicola]|uniref:Uncharacterized protein n=1 Tax=Venturia nashicola TaxID=86259 RepID=A0A4Z1NXK6_9PEZI|nr:hypothetical protein E6O75_ATG05451 [Venturia nashicola]TLD32340.1 hypothetical protein E2P81_ATG05316 [Venturia nashicola]